MIIPSTGVSFAAAAAILLLMLCQWFIGGMSRRELRGQTPERGPARAAVEFKQAA